MNEKSSAWLLAVVLACSGCRQILGVEERQSETRVCRVYAFADPGCAACVDECCDEATVCRADTACNDALECIAQCDHGDAACRKECEDGAVLTEARVALRACEATKCASACALSCGGAGPPRGDAAGTMKDGGCDCADDCCHEAARGAQSRECGQIEVCRTACPAGDVACRERCVDDFPEGASRRAALAECKIRACGGQADWSCVGSVVWETPESAETITLLVSPGQPAAIKACESDACQQPVDQGGPGYTQTLEVPPGPIGYRGPLLLETTAESDFGELSFLFYLQPPFVRDSHLRLGLFDFGAVAASLDVDLMQDRGHLKLVALDCRGLGGGPGAAVSAHSADDQTRVFYSSYRASTYSFQTDPSESVGEVVFFNLPAGEVSITTFVNGLCVQSGTLDIAIRAGTMTVADMMPTP